MKELFTLAPLSASDLKPSFFRAPLISPWISCWTCDIRRGTDQQSSFRRDHELFLGDKWSDLMSSPSKFWTNDSDCTLNLFLCIRAEKRMCCLVFEYKWGDKFCFLRLIRIILSPVWIIEVDVKDGVSLCGRQLKFIAINQEDQCYNADLSQTTCCSESLRVNTGWRQRKVLIVESQFCTQRNFLTSTKGLESSAWKSVLHQRWDTRGQ